MNFKKITLNVYCKVKAFTQDKEGATAIEYAVIAGLIVIAIVATLKTLGGKLDGVFQAVVTAIT